VERIAGGQVEEPCGLLCVPAAQAGSLGSFGVQAWRGGPGGDVVREEPVADGLAERLAQDRVGVRHRLALERATSASAAMLQVYEVQVELVDGELTDQTPAEPGTQVAAGHVVVALVGGGLDPGVQQGQPFVEVGVQGHRGDIRVHNANVLVKPLFRASRVQIRGVPIKVVSERLGHSTITMAMDTYAQVMPAPDRNAAHAIRRALSTPRSVTEEARRGVRG
jgi:hypothetical protein